VSGFSLVLISCFSQETRSYTQQDNGIGVAQLTSPVENDFDLPRLLTIRETANMLQISRGTLLLMAKNKKLPAIKVGNQWRVVERELAKWLEGVNKRRGLVS
jgi:excisionase family DNA binding protein